MSFNYTTITSVSDKAGISPRTAEEFLSCAYRSDGRRTIDLQRTLGMPSSVFQLLESYFSGLVVRDSDRLYISEDGRHYVEALRDFREQRDESFALQLSSIENTLAGLQNEMPKSKKRLDQVRATPDTVARRIEILYRRGWLEDRNIMLMGDNDFVSLGLAMTALPKRIFVLDIDHDVIRFINTFKAAHDFDIDCSRYDAREPFSRNLSGRFDVAITDPPYDPTYFDLFVSRCAAGVQKENGVVVISYGYSERARERALPMQDSITRHGLIIEEVIPAFNRYYSAQGIGSQSALYVCRTTPRTSEEDIFDQTAAERTRPRKRSLRDHRIKRPKNRR